jgi:hypothetical protein
LLTHAAVRAGAQSAGPATDSLLSRAERGDPAAAHAAEALGWRFVKQVADNGRLDAVTARTMARTALFLEGPLPAPDAAPTAKERVWRSAAVNALEMALAQDSGDVWSASELERIAPYPYIWMGPDKELVALRALLARRADLPSSLRLTRIRLELERGSADSAAEWLTRLPAGTVSPAARGHLAAEVAFARRNDSIGAAEYYDGAAAIHDPADAAWYARDLAWIAQPDELTEWNALAPAARKAWLERFWNRRDIDDGQLPGTRLPEQFRRWRVALRNYRWVYDGSTAQGIIIPHYDGAEYNVDDDQFPWDSTVSSLAYVNRMRPLSQVLDDRGGLVLRHGDPVSQVNLTGVDALSEQTIVWATPGGRLVVSFSRSVDSISGAAANSLRFGMIARNYPAGDLSTNCQVESRLCTLAAMVRRLPPPPHTSMPPTPKTDMRVMAEAVHKDFTRMRTEAEHTDGNPEIFTNDLHAIAQAYGVPDVGLLVVFAVPARDLLPDVRQRVSATSFGARLRIVAGDSARGEFAAALDTTRSWKLAAPPDDKTYLTGYVVVPAATGAWSVAVVLSDLARRAGSGERIRNVPVVAFDGKALQLSDPILGSNESGLTWNHDGDRIPLNPRNAWRPDELAVLSYQLDGLVRGRSYETRIEIWQGVSLKNSLIAASAATSQAMTAQKELSLRELAPGDYRIVLRIRDTVTGAEVSRERRLAVRE